MSKLKREYIDDFKINGVTMPKPDEWEVDYQMLSQDAERLPGNGRAVVPYLGYALVTTWTYKIMGQEDYETLFNAYIKNTIDKKTMYHQVTTRDSNESRVITYQYYTEKEWKKPIYMYKNGKRVMKSLIVQFIQVEGGDETVCVIQKE